MRLWGFTERLLTPLGEPQTNPRATLEQQQALHGKGTGCQDLSHRASALQPEPRCPGPPHSGSGFLLVAVRKSDWMCLGASSISGTETSVAPGESAPPALPHCARHLHLPLWGGCPCTPVRRKGWQKGKREDCQQTRVARSLRSPWASAGGSFQENVQMQLIRVPSHHPRRVSVCTQAIGPTGQLAVH